MKKRPINNVVVISDTHFGCKLGLLPAPVMLDEGVSIVPSRLQEKVGDWWNEFWEDWVPEATHREPYCVVINGDSLDGVHHGSTTQITHNLTDQRKIAEKFLEPIAARCDGRLYVVRGTEAHVGKSGQEEEALAESLGAIPDEAGNHARNDLWLSIGSGVAHFLHHIGTAGSQAYESTALMKEFSESLTEAARWNRRPPNIVVRSHRHRHSEIRVPTVSGYGISFVTAGWQLKTPFTWKIAGARLAQPQVGGSVIRQGDFDLYTRHFTKSLDRSRCETPVIAATARRRNNAGENSDRDH